MFFLMMFFWTIVLLALPFRCLANSTACAFAPPPFRGSAIAPFLRNAARPSMAAYDSTLTYPPKTHPYLSFSYSIFTQRSFIPSASLYWRPHNYALKPRGLDPKSVLKCMLCAILLLHNRFHLLSFQNISINRYGTQMKEKLL